MSMTSSVPYLLRAMNEWILNNGCTPYLIVDATVKETSVPSKHVQDGQIVLNISPIAVRDLLIDNEYVVFSGRFRGVPHEIFAPIDAVIGIITKENGEGMWFSREEVEPEPPLTPTSNKGLKKKGPPQLKVVE